MGYYVTRSGKTADDPANAPVFYQTNQLDRIIIGNVAYTTSVSGNSIVLNPLT